MNVLPEDKIKTIDAQESNNVGMDNAVYDTIEKRSYKDANFKVESIENQ